jgi:DNA helicase IV
VTAEVAAEQRAVDGRYRRLDELRLRVAQQLDQTRRAGPSGSPQNRSERDAFAAAYEQRLAQLWAVEDRLVFGRLDREDGEVRHIGRIGLSDDEQNQLLVDWRADAAEGFYRATAADPEGVLRRRHIAMRGRRVVGVEDEVLDLERLASPEAADSLVLTGEGALLAALAEHRTGHMRDIVATIQAEQDRIIRAPLPGILVVQGGPGTGKTAVALHRAAFLLYRHRDRLARTGVLVVGPNPLFLRYIEQVLPSLGETSAVLSSVGGLYPGVETTLAEAEQVVVLKGDLGMVKVLASAVADRQRVPPRAVPVAVGRVVLQLRPQVVEEARGRARRSGRPHNLARRVFARHVLDDLARQLAAELGVELDERSREDLMGELHESVDVRREVNLCWMPASPEQVLTALWASPARLASAAPDLTSAERLALLRSPDQPWSVADVPLLDELAELLGEDDAAGRAAARRQASDRAEQVRYAQRVLGTSGAAGMVSADLLADRFGASETVESVAERAAADRAWAYGHVVVDEAQELSPMAWRLLLRRCPSGSMTAVGDPAQASSAAGPASWGQVLDDLAGGRWERAELTVNYRTPAEVMQLAAGALQRLGVDVAPPRSARSGSLPVVVAVPSIDAGAVERAVSAEWEVLGGGRLAVITPREGFGQLSADLRARMALADSGGGDLDAPVVVLDVGQAKGLEFDSVIVLEPSLVLSQSSKGAGDLYVALTRCTQRLTIVHSLPLPNAVADALRAKVGGPE